MGVNGDDDTLRGFGMHFVPQMAPAVASLTQTSSGSDGTWIASTYGCEMRTVVNITSLRPRTTQGSASCWFLASQTRFPFRPPSWSW